ncbi:transposase [Streptomyces sp. NPDC001588]
MTIATIVTARQVGRVVERLEAAGLLVGRPAPVFVFDSGYDLTRTSYLASQAGLKVQILGRVRSDRVYYAAPSGNRPDGQPGRPRKHGERFELGRPATWPVPDEQLAADSPRYGAVEVTAWHGLHQKLTRQAGWTGFVGTMPIVPGTVIRIKVERLPGNRAPQDLWLWHTAPADTIFDLDLLWKTYLRRFDVEHTFRLIKGVLGWTRPQIRTPEQGERWTWMILAAHAQLRLARTLTRDVRRPWERSVPSDRPMTPGRLAPLDDVGVVQPLPAQNRALVPGGGGVILGDDPQLVLGRETAALRSRRGILLGRTVLVMRVMLLSYPPTISDHSGASHPTVSERATCSGQGPRDARRGFRGTRSEHRHSLVDRAGHRPCRAGTAQVWCCRATPGAHPCRSRRTRQPGKASPTGEGHD